jgi:hypothetical protein
MAKNNVEFKCEKCKRTDIDELWAVWHDFEMEWFCEECHLKRKEKMAKQKDK